MSWYTDGAPFDEYEPESCKGCTIAISKKDCDRCMWLSEHCFDKEDEE